MKRDNELLTINQVLDKISHALQNKESLSLVRLGDLENIVMAQDSVLSFEEVMKTRFGTESKQTNNGISFPNLSLRDDLIESIKKADLVGVLRHEDEIIKAPKYLKRELTDKVFEHFNVKPKDQYDATITRQINDNKEFWDLLRGKRILVVTKRAKNFKQILEKEPFLQNVKLVYSLKHYDQIEDATNFIIENKDHFDVGLFSCGVNAVILCQRIAELTDKVCFDFGHIKKNGFSKS